MEYAGPGALKYRNTGHALQSIWRKEGMSGLFKGLGPTVLTNAPFSAMYYMFYRQLKETFSQPERPQAVVNFVSGSVAAATATIITQPFDVLRTSIQLSALRRSPFEALSAITAQQGFGGLFTGVVPRMAKRSLQTALVWTLYEELVPKLSTLIVAAKSQVM
ncbi:MAG: hypothetical protein WDW38_001957 [Sanguina aurantia]